MLLISRFSVLAALVYVSAPLAFGQFDSAAILGSVGDPKDAAVSGAKAMVQNTATGITASACW